MSKRQFKDTVKRIRWLCLRCDINYELTSKRFGEEQAILLWCPESESDPSGVADSYLLSAGLAFLESFYDDLRLIQKELRKADKDLRSQVLYLCTKVNMACAYTKRTRLNPPTYRLYDPVAYEQALGPKLSVDQVQNLFKIKRSDLSNTALPSRR